MNPTARRRPPIEEPASRGRLAEFLVRRRAGLGAIAVVLAAVAAGALVWSRVGDQVLWREDSLLTPAMIEVRGIAPWVTSDLKAEALRNASLDGGLPIGDPELANRLARAFDTHPWVRQVVRVEARHPAAATVEIACREPVAVVAVKGGTLAVDAEGVVLPSADFSPEAAAHYPRIVGIDSSPQGPEGSRWGDPLVEQGAALAALIGPEWKSLGLVECRPRGPREARSWELLGPESQIIVFGSTPGQERDDEPSTAARIARLKGLVGQPIPKEGVDLTAPADGGAGLSFPAGSLFSQG
jgi:hypothetical protein